jgi:hypothetical protein
VRYALNFLLIDGWGIGEGGEKRGICVHNLSSMLTWLHGR